MVIEPCEHEEVLAIFYDGKSRNISHYRCVNCGEKNSNAFGKEIIYSECDEKRKVEKENIKQHIISGLEEVKDLFEVIPTTENIKEQVKQIQHKFFEIANHLDLEVIKKKVYGDNDYIEEQAKDEPPRETKCFNKERIKDLKDKWKQYNMGWSSAKNDIPKELYEIIEEIIERLEKTKKNYEEDLVNIAYRSEEGLWELHDDNTDISYWLDDKFKLVRTTKY